MSGEIPAESQSSNKVSPDIRRFDKSFGWIRQITGKSGGSDEKTRNTDKTEAVHLGHTATIIGKIHPSLD